MSEIMRRGNPEPEPRPSWRRRVDRQRVQDAWTKVEVRKVEAAGKAEAHQIEAAGRARLHADRARYTAALTVGIGEEFKAMHYDMAHLRATDPDDPVLARALVEIEVLGFNTLKSHLRDHERDGRERFW